MLEQALQENTLALRELIALMKTGRKPQAEQPAVEAEAKAEPAAAPAPAAPAAADPAPQPVPAPAPAAAAPAPAEAPAPAAKAETKIDFDQVKALFRQRQKEWGASRLKEILQRFGAARLTEVLPEHWPEVLKLLEA